MRQIDAPAASRLQTCEQHHGRTVATCREERGTLRPQVPDALSVIILPFEADVLATILRNVPRLCLQPQLIRKLDLDTKLR